jgi:predicted DNA-binding protein (UPF0251 family)
MKTVEDYEEIRRAFFEGLSTHEIHWRLNVARQTIRKAISEPTSKRCRSRSRAPSGRSEYG